MIHPIRRFHAAYSELFGEEAWRKFKADLIRGALKGLIEGVFFWGAYFVIVLVLTYIIHH